MSRKILLFAFLICSLGAFATPVGTATICPYNTVTLTASGTGTWSALVSNPAVTVIDSPSAPITMITGFSVAGTYNFIWLTGGVSDTFRIIVTPKPNAGPDQTVSCYNTGSATMAAVGTGVWNAIFTNPGFSTIANPSSPTTTISGFTYPGVYYYVWTVNGCTDTAAITVGSVANDYCLNATPLGTLGTPAACGTSITAIKRGTSVTLTGQSNACASPTFPFPYQVSCPANLVSPPNDVWYSFVATANRATITVTGASFSNPSINVWGGGCTALEGLGCSSGAGGVDSVTAYQLTVGATYYVQVYGADSAQSGTFNISAYCSTDCSNCILVSDFTATPPPVNGAYLPGETVTFCYTITSWTQIAVDWLHGITPTFGPGWDTSTLVPGTPPAALSGDGTWSWYPQGETSSGGGSGLSFGPGFYFETDEGSACGCVDTDPGDNYGDDGDGPWTFCVTITTRNDTTCTAGANLSVSFYPTSDYQSGSWTEAACQTDPYIAVSAIGGCCPPLLTTTGSSCGAPDGSATASPQGSNGPWTLHWSNGVVQDHVTGPSTITGLNAGIITVTVTDIFACASVASDSVQAVIKPYGGSTKYASCILVDTVRMTALGNGFWFSLGTNPAPTTIVSPDSANTVISGLTVDGDYYYVWDVNGCMDTVEVIVSTKPNAGADQFTCVNGTATMAGTGVGVWSALPGNPTTTVIASPTSPTTTISGFTVGGTYNYIFTVATCSDTASVIIPPFTSSASILNSTLCKNQTTTLTAIGNPPALGPFNYSWSPAADVVSPTSATTSTEPVLAPTTYYVSVTTAGGCLLVDSVSVAVSGAAPVVAITPSNNGVCPGDTITLAGVALAQNLVYCGITDSCFSNNTNLSIPVPFGAGDTSNSTGSGGFTNVYCSPFMGSQNSYKIQYLFRASELNAAGLSSGTITDISFFVKTVNSTLPYDTFTISMGCTNLDSLTEFDNNLQVVTGPLTGINAPTIYPGWNSFPFYDVTTYNLTSFNWDGSSNIVIQVCYTINPTGNSNDDFVSYTTTPYNGSSIYTGDYGFDDPPNGCSYSYACCGSFNYGINNTRPTVKFGMCVPNILTYQWSPAGSVTCPTCLSTQAIIDSSTCFTLSVSDNGCNNDSVICITTNPYIPLKITPADTTICNVGDFLSLSTSLVNPAPGGCALGYSVDSIPYNAVAGTFVSIAGAAYKDQYGNTRATSAGVAGPYAIGFNFPFYCQTFDSFYVDADGFITFQYPYTYGQAAWEYTAETLPPSSFPPLRSIFLLMGHYDLNSSFGGVGNAKYELTGTAPNRTLVVKYTNMADYNTEATRTNGEIILYETSGIIDVLITSTTYSADPHTTGVVDSTGYGTAAPGMNNQNYTVSAGSPVAWRFTPEYGPSVVQTGLLWLPAPGITPVNDTMNTVSVAPDSSVTYRVQASYIINQFTTPEGCVVRDSAKVTIAPLIDTIKAVPQVICPGGTSQLRLTNTTNITSYSWNHGTDLSDSTISNPVATISDSTLFIVSLVNSMGCTTKDSLTLNTFPNQYPVIGPSTTICYSDSVQLSLYGSYSGFQWYYIDTANGTHTLVSSGPADSTYYAHPPGYYELEATASPSGCTYTSNVVLVDTFAREAIAVDTSGPTSFCSGGSVILSVTPGLNNIMWTPDSFGSQMFIPVSLSGTFSYTARDAHNCLLFSNTVTVTVDPRPAVNVAFSKNPVCTGETAQIIATTNPAGVPVVWQLAGVQVASGDTFNGAAPGSYEVIAAPACPDTVPAVLNSAVSPTVTLGPDIDSCTCSPNIVIDPVVNPSSAQDSFSWSTGTSGSTYAVTTSGSGTYTVTVFDANNCTATASIAVNVICVPTSAFASPDTTFPGAVFTLNDSPSVSGFSYLWTTTDSATITSPAQAQTNATSGNMQAGVDTFHLHVIDPSSTCYGDTILYVVVITKDSFVFPTAFTPNGDGKNDYFYPVFNDVSGAHIKALRIYDRWGQLVYDDPNQPGWDGNYKGKPQPVGTYMIFMTVQVPDPGNASRLIEKSVETSFQLFR